MSSESESGYGGIDSSESQNMNQSYSSSQQFQSNRGSYGKDSLNNSISVNDSANIEKAQSVNQDGNSKAANSKNNYESVIDKNLEKVFDNLDDPEEMNHEETNKTILNLIEDKYESFGFDRTIFDNEFKPN